MPATKKLAKRSGTAHFKISGPDMTRIARDRMLDDNPGSAWRIANCLVGEGVAEAALRILQGTAKLVGTETDMRLANEKLAADGLPVNLKTRKYVEQFTYLYAGRIKIRERWYQPIARVIDFGINDLKNNHGVSTATRTSESYTSYIPNRQWHYAHTDEIAPACQNDDLIFVACGERPHWQTPPRDPDAALAEFLAAGRALDRRGHSIWYPSQPEREEPSFSRGAPRLPVNVPMTSPDAYRLSPSVDCMQREREAIQAGSLDAMNHRLMAEKQLQDQLDEFAADTLRDEEDNASYLRRIADLRVLILKQAGTDFLTLTWTSPPVTADEVETQAAWGETSPPASGSVQVPRAPFMHWALARLRTYADQLPPWTTVSPVGMKLMLDDANHTDWLIGAGFDPRKFVLDHGPITQAAYALGSRLQDMLDRPAVHVLVDGPACSGTVVFGKPGVEAPEGAIVMLPNLHPRYVKTVAYAAAVITEEGGATAHLAQVGRDRLLPMVRIPGALSKFCEGDEVMVNTSARIVLGL